LTPKTVGRWIGVIDRAVGNVLDDDLAGVEPLGGLFGCFVLHLSETDYSGAGPAPANSRQRECTSIA
jgi:hypothetical protein